MDSSVYRREEISYLGGRTMLSDIIVGICLMVFSSVCGSVHAHILLVIWRDKELIRSPTYRIIFSLGICDILQCIPHFISGIFTIFQSVFHPLLAKCLSVLGTPCYVAYCVLTVLLAFNRLLVIASPRYSETLFSAPISYIWCAITVLSFLVFAFFVASPWATLVYAPELYSWAYDFDLPLSGIVQKSAMITELTCAAIFSLFYVYTLTAVYIKRKQFVSSSKNRMELKILIESAVVAAYCAVMNILWHQSQVFPSSIWLVMTLNFMWVLNSGVHPLMYIIVNRTIRDRIANKRKGAVFFISQNVTKTGKRIQNTL